MSRSMAVLMIGGLALALANFAQASGAGTSSDTPSPLPLMEGVEWLRGTFPPGGQPDGNSLILRGRRGLILIDTGRHEAHVQTLLEAAASRGLPVTAIINTHWHLDHVAGNGPVRHRHPRAAVWASDAIVQAQQGFLETYRQQLESAIAVEANPETASEWRREIERIDRGKALLPTVIIARSGRHRIDGRWLRLGLGVGATQGDVWVLDEASATLATGDLVTLPVPFLDTAVPSSWLAMLDTLLSLPAVRVVPGHGEPMSMDALRRYRDAFARLMECAATDSAAASCADAWIHDLESVLPVSDRERVGPMIQYYVDEVLRPAASRVERSARRSGQTSQHFDGDIRMAEQVEMPNTRQGRATVDRQIVRRNIFPQRAP